MHHVYQLQQPFSQLLHSDNFLLIGCLLFAVAASSCMWLHASHSPQLLVTCQGSVNGPYQEYIIGLGSLQLQPAGSPA